MSSLLGDNRISTHIWDRQPDDLPRTPRQGSWLAPIWTVPQSDEGSDAGGLWPLPPVGVRG
jgi:hypothetical protein